MSHCHTLWVYIILISLVCRNSNQVQQQWFSLNKILEIIKTVWIYRETVINFRKSGKEIDRKKRNLFDIPFKLEKNTIFFFHVIVIAPKITHLPSSPWYDDDFLFFQRKTLVGSTSKTWILRGVSIGPI